MAKKVKLEDLQYVGAQEVVEQPAEEIAEEAVVVEAPEPVKEAAEEAVPEEATPEPVEEAPVEYEIEIVPEPAVQASSDYTSNQIVPVQNIRLYRTPDIHQVAKIFTGNVVFIGRIGSFACVEYVKAGFGTVRAYTKDI